MKIIYEIHFLDYWHMSSGMGAGARHDASVVKDDDGLPFVPGKTLKGLARETAELLEAEGFVETCFGAEGGRAGTCRFSSAVIEEDVQREIVAEGLQKYLYDEIASTAIGENGIAKDNSLRETEVTVPIVLHGSVADVPEAFVEPMKQSLSMIKRMGRSRSRGLGRCRIAIKDVR